MLRRKIRAYEHFAQEGEIQVANKVYASLRTSRVINPVRFFNIAISSETISEYLSYKLFNQKLSDHLFSSLLSPDELVLPNNLPGAWRSYLKSNHGIRSGIFSSLRWRQFGFKQLLVCLAYGLIVAARILTTKKRDARTGIYLDGLTEENIPRQKTGNKYNIVDYFRTLRSTETIYANIHKNGVATDSGVIPVLSPFDGINAWQTPRIILFILALSLASIFSIALGRGLLAALSVEIFKTRLAYFLDERSVCREYAFYNSWSVYRPAWTYVLEQKGALITLYFYSINCLPFNIDGKLLDTHYTYQNMSWKHYIIWNAAMTRFLVNNSRFDATVEITKPVTFSDNDQKTPPMKNKVAVFDVTPTRYALFYQYAPLTDYYSSKTKNNFYIDIAETARELGFELVFKRKRSFATTTSKKYVNLINHLESLDHIEFADPDISAHRLIRDCKAVVSMPFTSTAHIGEFFDKPSIYYDGTGRISNSEPTAMGIVMISDKKALKSWLQSIR